MRTVDPVLEILNALKGSITPPRVNTDRTATYPDPIVKEGRLIGTYYDSYTHDHLHEITVQGQTYRLMVSEYLPLDNDTPSRVDGLFIGSTRHPALQVPGSYPIGGPELLGRHPRLAPADAQAAKAKSK